MEITTFNHSERHRSGFANTWLSFLAVFGLILTSQLSSGQCVAPTFSNGCNDGDMINSLTIQPLGFVHANTGCSTGAYGDYTDDFEFPELQAGETYTFITTHEWAEQRVRVWIDFNDDGIFQDVGEESELVGSGTSSGANAASVTTFSVIIPADAVQGEHRLRIATKFNTAPVPCSNTGYGEAHDYTVVILPPNPCVAPTLVSVDGVTLNSALLSWESDGTAFELEYGEPGFTLGDGTTLSMTINSAEITGLDENTSYVFYVRNNCGSDSFSSWVGPVSFYTGHCIPPASTGTGYIINSVSTSNGYTNISNTTGTTASPAYYGDFTEMAILQSAGGEFDYSVSVPGYTNVEIWIDFNNNLLFDNDELVGFHAYSSAATTFTGTVMIPEDQENGDYRMRVRSRYYYNTSATPCGSLANGETEDYTVSVVDQPTCMPPTSLEAQYVTMESATLAWESDGTVFDIEYGVAPFTQGDGEPVSNVSNFYEVTGLEADTMYQFYVSTDCGADGNSYWAGPFSFFTGYCGVSTTNSIDYTSSFATINAISNVSYTANSQPPGSYANLTDNVIEHALGLPPIEFTHTYVSGGQTVNIWVDWNNDLEFDNSPEGNEKVYSFYSGTNGQSGIFSIPDDVEPGTYRMRLRSLWGSGANPLPCGNAAYGSTLDFTFEVHPAPACLPPSSLSVEDFTQESATLYWESDSTLFNIEYGQAPFEVGEGIPMNGVANGVSISNLDADTAYQFYVQADCGADGVSFWTGPYNFFTGYCVPPASTSSGYIINAVSTLGGYTNISNTTGNTPSPNSYGNFSEDMVVSQSPGGEFTYAINVPGYTNVEIWADLNQNFVFDADELIGAHAYATSATTFTGVITVPDDLELGDYRVRVRSRYYYNTTASACGAAVYGETEDYTLSVVEPPLCMPPTDLGVTDVTLDSATLFWEADGTLFDIEYGEAPIGLGDGTAVNGVANFYEIDGLMSDTNYQFYVRQDCGTDGESFWAGPFTFLTGYCAVSTTNTGDYINSFSTTQALTNVAYTATAQPAGSYANLTDNVITQASGLPFNFTSIYVGGIQTVNIWVDWDGDLTFDDSMDGEKVYSDSAQQTQNGVITIPEGTPVGTYRMRVRGQWGTGANPPPCGNVSYGSTLDFTLEVVEAPTCMPPTALAADNLTFETADISWEGDGNLYDIEYGQAPFSIGEGIPVNGISNEYSLTNLDPETSYQFYVRLDCGGGDKSFWSGPYTFYTGYCTVTRSNNGDYISAFSTTNAVENISYTAASSAGGAYINETASVIEQLAGETFNFSTTYVGGGQRVKIWVDWDQNLIFDDSAESDERVFNIYSSSTTQTGEIAVPDYIEAGTYRMRVRSQWGSDANPLPCGNAAWGTTIDFTLVVLGELSTGDHNLSSLKLYPNPVADMLYLAHTDNISNVEIYNMIGQQVIVKTINAAQGQIDMSNLAAGTYLVKVAADHGIKTLKVIKQ